MSFYLRRRGKEENSGVKKEEQPTPSNHNNPQETTAEAAQDNVAETQTPTGKLLRSSQSSQDEESTLLTESQIAGETGTSIESALQTDDNNNLSFISNRERSFASGADPEFSSLSSSGHVRASPRNVSSQNATPRRVSSGSKFASSPISFAMQPNKITTSFPGKKFI